MPSLDPPSNILSAENQALADYIAKAVDERVRLALANILELPEDAKDAAKARLAANARGFFWVSEFAAVIGRHKQFVSDRCSKRMIRTLRGGKPYRIPLTEEAIWNKLVA